MSQWDKASLRRVLAERLSLSELQDAAFDQSIDYEGVDKSELARRLVLDLDRRGELDQLIDWLTRHRLDIDMQAIEAPVRAGHRDAQAHPELRLMLFSAKGERTRWGHTSDAPVSYIYHVRVNNEGEQAAHAVGVKIIRIDKWSEAGGHTTEELPSPVKLRWSRPQADPCALDITAGDFETCNLGYIIEEDRRAWGQRQRAYRFELNPCVDPWPPNFQGFVYPAERMQVQIVAVAGNARSDVLSIEIAWDGEWGHTAEEMQHHLAVNETGFSRPP